MIASPGKEELMMKAKSIFTLGVGLREGAPCEQVFAGKKSKIRGVPSLPSYFTDFPLYFNSTGWVKHIISRGWGGFRSLPNLSKPVYPKKMNGQKF